MSNEVQEFMDKHGACREGREWAESSCKTMSEVYEKCQRGDWLMWVLRKADVLTKRDSVGIAVTCARHVLPLWEKRYPADKTARAAIESAEAVLANDCAETRNVARKAAAYAAAYADAYAAAYADAEAAEAAERLWHADMIRGKVANPWKAGKGGGG